MQETQEEDEEMEDKKWGRGRSTERNKKAINVTETTNWRREDRM